jgi:hypothetical protein
MEKKRIETGDVIVGERSLRMQSLESRDTLAQTNSLEIGASLLSGKRRRCADQPSPIKANSIQSEVP